MAVCVATNHTPEEPNDLREKGPSPGKSRVGGRLGGLPEGQCSQAGLFICSPVVAPPFVSKFDREPRTLSASLFGKRVVQDALAAGGQSGVPMGCQWGANGGQCRNRFSCLCLPCHFPVVPQINGSNGYHRRPPLASCFGEAQTQSRLVPERSSVIRQRAGTYPVPARPDVSLPAHHGRFGASTPFSSQLSCAPARGRSVSISDLQPCDAISIHFSTFISHLSSPSPRCLGRLGVPHAAKNRCGDGSYQPRRLYPAGLGSMSGISSPFDFILVVVPGGKPDQHEQRTTLSRRSGGQESIRLALPPRWCRRRTRRTQHDAARCHHDPRRRTGVPWIISSPTSEALVSGAQKEVCRD